MGREKGRVEIWQEKSNFLNATFGFPALAGYLIPRDAGGVPREEQLRVLWEKTALPHPNPTAREISDIRRELIIGEKIFKGGQGGTKKKKEKKKKKNKPTQTRPAPSCLMRRRWEPGVRRHSLPAPDAGRAATKRKA